MNQETLPIDSEAEREALEQPLTPTMRRNAERQIDQLNHFGGRQTGDILRSVSIQESAYSIIAKSGEVSWQFTRKQPILVRQPLDNIAMADLIQDCINEDFGVKEEEILTNYLIYYFSQDQQLFIDKLTDLMGTNTNTISVSITDIENFNPKLLELIIKKPQRMQVLLNDAAKQYAVKLESTLQQIHIQCMLTADPNIPSQQLPPLSVRQVGTSHVNKLIVVNALVTSKSTKTAVMSQIYLFCKNCGNVCGPFTNPQLYSAALLGVSKSPVRIQTSCPACRSRALGIEQKLSTWTDTQKLTVQEINAPAGFTPYQIDVIVTGDQIERCNCGDNVCIVANATVCNINDIVGGQESLQTVLIANSITSLNQMEITGLSSAVMQSFNKLSQTLTERNRQKLLCDSLLPQLSLPNYIKLALLLTLISGTPKRNAKNWRSHIHTLLIGDPSTAKSAILHQLHQLPLKSIITTGKAASAAGLTAAVIKVGDAFTVAAGSLPLSDGGICMIDECDKMTIKDRVALHEAMESQTVSICKAGINTQLNARCSVIAAANPNTATQNWSEANTCEANTNLGDALLSRFDLIIVMQDVVDAEEDLLKSQVVMNKFISEQQDVQDLIKQRQALIEQINKAQQSQTDIDQDLIDQYKQELEEINNKLKIMFTDEQLERYLIQHNMSSNQTVFSSTTLAQYITYARTIETFLPQEVSQKLQNFYLKCRSFRVSQRLINTLIRLTEANARLQLRKNCTLYDADVACWLVATLLVKQTRLAERAKVRSALSVELASQSIHQNNQQDNQNEAQLVTNYQLITILDQAFEKLNIYNTTVGQNEENKINYITVSYLILLCKQEGINWDDNWIRDGKIGNYQIIEDKIYQNQQ